MTAPQLDSEGLWEDSPGSITVTSHKRVDVAHLCPGDVSIGDIAHSLSRLCRYNGHVGSFLSVARHSLWVADHVMDGFGSHEPIDWDLVLLALLHDAAEAYLGDLVRPLKHGALGGPYLELEAYVEEVIAVAFRLPFPHPPIIKDADNYVLLNIELGATPARWTWQGDFRRDEIEFKTAYNKIQENR